MDGPDHWTEHDQHRYFIGTLASPRGRRTIPSLPGGAARPQQRTRDNLPPAGWDGVWSWRDVPGTVTRKDLPLYFALNHGAHRRRSRCIHRWRQPQITALLTGSIYQDTDGNWPLWTLVAGGPRHCCGGEYCTTPRMTFKEWRTTGHEKHAFSTALQSTPPTSTFNSFFSW
jgi:hypothetical protein